MDQHQQVFQSTSRGDHGEAGVGHTHDFFPALVYGSAETAELAADIRRIRFLLCLAQPIGNEKRDIIDHFSQHIFCSLHHSFSSHDPLIQHNRHSAGCHTQHSFRKLRCIYRRNKYKE